MVSDENRKPMPGSTLNRKYSCTSSGVLRTNSMNSQVARLTARIRDRRSRASSRPSANATTEPSTVASKVTSRPRRTSGITRPVNSQSQIT